MGNILSENFHELVKPRGNNRHGIYLFDGFFTPKLCQTYKQMIFVFGDNMQREGKGGQACIRDEFNSVGIRTKVNPDRYTYSYFSDDQYSKYAKIIEYDIANIKDLLSYHHIVLSKNGYGNGLAELDIRAPKLYSHLCSLLNILCGTYIFPINKETEHARN